MDNIIHPFQIPIYQSFIEEDSFTQIKEDVNTFIANHPQDFNLSWDCPTLSNINSSSQFKSISLENELKKATKIYFEAWGYEGRYNLEFSQVWINISPKGSFQEVHKHGDYFDKSLFSGVLYIDTNKDSGNITLINTIEDQLLFSLPTSKTLARLSIPPENRKILCFPSWMDHFVGVNKSNQNRISLSWNIKVLL